MVNKSVVKSLVFSVSMLLFFILLAVGFSLFSDGNRQRITLQNREYLIDSSSRSAQEIDNAISDGYRNIKVLSDLLSYSLSSPEIDVVFLQKLLSRSVFDFIEFADLNGMDHNITGGVSDAHDRQYYLDGIKGNIGLEVIYRSRATYETLMMFYAPVYYNDSIIGSLVGTYQASNRVKKYLDSRFYGYKADCFLCTSEGTIVSSSTDIDTTQQIKIQEYVGDKPKIRMSLENSLKTGLTDIFSEEADEAGVYIKKLKDNDFYFVQIFPEFANKKIISQSSKQVISLIIYMLILYAVAFVSIVIFYSQQRKQVNKANNAKSVFLLNMSHDIRTPMNAILGFTELASKHIDDKKTVQEYLDKILLSGENLLSLINDVLNMSRIESGRVYIDNSPNNLEDIVKNMDALLRTQFEEKQIDFRVDCSGVTDKYVSCDKAHISQVLMNLLGNTLKFTKSGGTVWFTLKQLPDENKNTYMFSVRDTGIGISKEFINKLFAPFEREDNTTVNKIQGTGLGLSITKRLIDMMGGRIEVSSEEGKGTEFRVYLTLNTSTAPKLEKTDWASQEFSLKGKKILVAEDNDFNMEIAVEILEEAGCVVLQAENGKIAADKVLTAAPEDIDLVLMDIQMPVMNGLDSAKLIRSSKGPMKDIPIIALSANVFEEDVQKCLQAGMNSFVLKPIQIPMLLEAITSII